ncbi:MAG TPA: hypothetical protein VFQ84_08945 [Arenimonas sp.]|uniref:hypothetical protein n=1 Tax=Arenimonas sp. TaxID=1872635 RepID=UPI002D7FA09F|nr:hypothetical protein [Arenimonas sp.]HEU0153456.1 hypothetical protein [Arenimonas sp.]
MAFRADESAREGFEEVIRYFCRPQGVSDVERARSKDFLVDVLHGCGPVVDAYPTWHPLVTNHDPRRPETTPNGRCGYDGLDHTRFFANGFITCPYDDGQSVLDSVARLPSHPIATITAERLDVKLYHANTTPILVRCEWERLMEPGGTIPLSTALPLLLEKEIPCWRWSEVAETWESMRPYFLGRPHGSRSSLFVTQETGQAIKKIWEAIIYSGMYGNIKV